MNTEVIELEHNKIYNKINEANARNKEKVRKEFFWRINVIVRTELSAKINEYINK